MCIRDSYLGRYGQWLTGFSMMFLMYALTAAYISGAGELLASSISDWTGISMSATAGVLLFTFVAGGVVCVGTSLVDLFNRFLFSAKIIFLVVMLVLLLPHIHKVNLLTLPLQQGQMCIRDRYGAVVHTDDQPMFNFRMLNQH